MPGCSPTAVRNLFDMKGIVLLFVLISTQVVNAQKKQVFIKGRIDISKFTSDNPNNFYEVNSLTGFNTGVLAKLPFNKKIALQPRLQLSSKGAKQKGVIRRTLRVILTLLPTLYILNCR